MEHKIVTAAKIAKSQGIKFIASVVKSHYATTYYNVVDVDSIIAKGAWIPANRSHHGYRLGQSRLPDKTWSRAYALSQVEGR